MEINGILNRNFFNDFTKVKKDAEDKLGTKIEDVVITCPANFDDSQRKATKAAGEIAGLKF